MKEWTKHHLKREIDTISNPAAGVSLSQLREKRHQLEGFGRAVLLYGDMDEPELLQLRRDVYVAFARGAARALAQLSISETPPPWSRAEEIELFGSIEGAEHALRNHRE